MSEFDAFEGTAPTEEDPAAAFLAREQDQMAELEGDAFSSEVPENTDVSKQEPIFSENTEAVLESAEASIDATPKTDGQTEPSIETVNAEFDPTFADIDNGSGTADVADMFGSEPAEPSSMIRNDLVDAFSSEPTSDPYSDFSQNQDQYAAISSQDRTVQEPEKIRVWREEQKESLATKDAEAEVKREEWREVAKRELEDWYRHREEQLEKSKKNNREAEAAFCQERDESLPGHEWERVTRLCEFNPKAARNSKDVSRMRSILLQLKQTPLVR